MTGSLAQSLVDAAYQAHTLDRTDLDYGETAGDLVRWNADRRAKSVAAAVVEALAAAEMTFGVGTLEDLARQIREGR